MKLSVCVLRGPAVALSPDPCLTAARGRSSFPAHRTLARKMTILYHSSQNYHNRLPNLLHLINTHGYQFKPHQNWSAHTAGVGSDPSIPCILPMKTTHLTQDWE